MSLAPAALSGTRCARVSLDARHGWDHGWKVQAYELEPSPVSAPRAQIDREPAGLDAASRQAVDSGLTTGLTPAGVLNLQRSVGNAGVQRLLEDEERSPVHDVVGSGTGSPLESGTRTMMEERLGHDFSDVRIHTGPKADESARSINAVAYTVGSDVVFSSGHYSPDTPTGQRVLAHELTHVVQQETGPVDGSPAPGGIRLSDPSDRFEQAAERAATEATSAPAAVQPAIQREDEEEEEETAQALVAQREGEEEEEETAQAFVAQREGEEEEEEPQA